MSGRIYGRTKSGEPIDDEMINRFADEAERGYDLGQLKERRRGRGRPRWEEQPSLSSLFDWIRRNQGD